jgi:hypothetical protein
LVFGKGAGIYNEGVNVSVRNTTMGNNSVGWYSSGEHTNWQNIYNGSGGGSLTVEFSTLRDSTSAEIVKEPSDGPAMILNDVGAGPVKIKGSILAAYAGIACDGDAFDDSDGGNLVVFNHGWICETTTWFKAGSDQTTADPHLGDLTQNSAGTWQYNPDPANSDAIDMIPSNDCTWIGLPMTWVIVDQSDAPRPTSIEAEKCDAGAVELGVGKDTK